MTNRYKEKKDRIYIVKNMLEMRSSTNYILTDRKEENAILIDAGFPDIGVPLQEIPNHPEKIKKSISKLVGKDINIKYILLTHGHIDHSYSAKVYSEIYSAPIYLGKQDSEPFSSSSHHPSKTEIASECPFSPLKSILGLSIDPSKSILQPSCEKFHCGDFVYGVKAPVMETICYFENTHNETENIIKMDDWNLTVYRTPGHTPGSVCFYDKDGKIFITGDLILPDSWATTSLEFSKTLNDDVDKLHAGYWKFPGGSKKDLLNSLAFLSKAIKKVDVLLCGHGHPIYKENIMDLLNKLYSHYGVK